jgi:hypothetical protein
VLLKLMDRWTLHLAFANSRSGTQLARNTVMSYYRHVKNWLLAEFPQHRATIERQLLGMRKTLEHFCVKQQNTLVKKAPACTKEDFRLMIDGIFSDATSVKAYQDAVLLSLMWYAFGMASDLSFVRKCNLSDAADDVLFLRFVRTETSEEQGTTLFPDQGSFVMCPLHELVNINRDLTERLEALEKHMRTKQQPKIAHDDSVDGCFPGFSSPYEEVS